MNNVFNYAKTYPIQLESSYKYTGRAGTCKYSSAAGKIKVAGIVNITPKSPSALMAAVAKTNVAIALCASSSSFMYYKSGILSSTSCGTCLNHAVNVIGYGTSNGTPFWLIRNSWGTSWGESGYMRILRKTTSDAGICGL